MVTIQKPEPCDGPHGLSAPSDYWNQDDFLLYQIDRIAEEIDEIREEWLSGMANRHTVTASQWVAKYAVELSSRLAESLIEEYEKEGK